MVVVEQGPQGGPVLAVHLEAGQVSLRQRPQPKLRPGYALLRLRLAGICNTDLELQRGYYGFAGQPGHEFVADVVACAPPATPDGDAEGDPHSAPTRRPADWVGRRVVGEINLACRRCPWCRRGLGRHCPQRTVLGIVRHPGAFAELFTLPVANLLAVPAAMPDEVAVFAEPVAAACEILEQLGSVRDRSVAVVGDGKLGLLIGLVLQASGARVTHFGRHAAKLKLVAASGATTVLLPKQRLPRQQFPLAVDATGSPDGLQLAIGLTESRGTVVMKSTVASQVTFNAAEAIVREITLVGSRCGRFRPALRLLRAGLPVLPLIHASYRLAEAPQAFAHAAERGVLKVLLRP